MLPLDELNYQLIHRELQKFGAPNPKIYGPENHYYKEGVGVMDLLGQLCELSTFSVLKYIIPDDVYPRYFDVIPEEKVLCTISVNSDWICQLPVDDDCILLLPNPIIPTGRYLHQQELSRLDAWLTERPGRWLVLDCVYDFSLSAYSSIKSGLRSRNVIWLNSHSKRYGQPHRQGWACSPIALPGFSQCHDIDFPDLPATEKLFSSAWEEVKKNYCDVPINLPETGYMCLVDIDYQVLRDKCHVAAIPFSVFGGSEKRSVLSCLALVGGLYD